MSPPAPRPTPGPRLSITVELCGLPGAGKTTLAAAVVARLHALGVPADVVDLDVSAATPAARRLPRKLARVGAALVADPVAGLRAGATLAASQRHPRDRVAVPVQWWSTRTTLRRAGRHPGVAVIEEGLVQALWTAGLRSRRQPVGSLVGLVGATPRPDLVLHVDVPAEQCLQRLGSRPSTHSRVQRGTPGGQPEELRRGARLMRDLIAAWVEADVSRVAQVDAGPLELTVAEALRQLDRCLLDERTPGHGG